jgi:ubiquinone/menaquinone biosynthesis C-methylase UbiE
MQKDFSTITELPYSAVTELQLKRTHQRYLFASNYCRNRIVLEVGCGGGQGLNLLSQKADKVFAGDIHRTNTDICKKTYRNSPKIKILDNLDAQDLNFKASSVDIIISFELIYYLSDIDRFFFEANRILSKKGHLIICTTNKDWSDFNRSPFSTKYFSVPELYNKAKSFGFSVNMFGSFPDSHTNITSKLVSIIKRIVVRLHLMPKTMKGKVLFKKMFLGKMVSMPLVLSEDMFSYESPVPIPENEIDRIHTAIFAVCQKI